MQKLSYIPYIFILFVIGIFVTMVALDHKRLPVDSDWEGISIASDLLDKQTFTNGQHFNWMLMKVPSNIILDAKDKKTKNPGYDYAPGYPFFIAAISWFAPSSAKEFNCYITKQDECDLNRISNLILLAQTIVGIIALVLSFLLALELSKSTEVAALVMLLILFTGRLSEHSQILRPYIIIMTLTLAFCYFFWLAYKQKSIILGLVSGLIFGLVVLFHPPLVLVPFFIIPLLILIMSGHRGQALALSLSLIIGYGITLMPWLLRNYGLFGDWALTNADAYTNLARRVAYNQMSLTEWFSAFMVWTPGPGESLAQYFVQPYHLERLGSINEIQSISRGASQLVIPFFQDLDPTTIYQKLLNTYVFNDMVNYLSSMFPLFVRGIWGTGNLIGLFGFIFLWPLYKRLIATGSHAPFSLIFGVMIACQLSQTVLSPNLPFYNGFVIFVYSYAIAYVSGGLELLPMVRRWAFQIYRVDRPSP